MSAAIVLRQFSPRLLVLPFLLSVGVSAIALVLFPEASEQLFDAIVVPSIQAPDELVLMLAALLIVVFVLLIVIATFRDYTFEWAFPFILPAILGAIEIELLGMDSKPYFLDSTVHISWFLLSFWWYYMCIAVAQDRHAAFWRIRYALLAAYLADSGVRFFFEAYLGLLGYLLGFALFVALLASIRRSFSSFPAKLA